MTLTLLGVTLGIVPSLLERLHSTSLSRFPFQMSWITEKDVLVSSEIHIDNDFMQTLLKRIDELELELGTHKRQVETLQQQADKLVKRGHFEKDIIETQTADIVEAFALLESKVKSQKGQLLIKQKIYQVIVLPTAFSAIPKHCSVKFKDQRWFCRFALSMSWPFKLQPFINVETWSVPSPDEPCALFTS